MTFEGQSVWITGGRSGIGRALAERFISEGADVSISGRDAAELRAVASEIGAHALPCDVTDASEVRAAYAQLLEKQGSVDILVNNAGTTVFRPFLETSVEDFDRLVATNLRGPFLTTREVLPAMMERGNGTILMINSMAALQVFPNSSVYAATKGGLKMLADDLRGEVRGTGVRVISVFPGATNTPIWPEKVREKHAERMMTAGDVAEAAIAACAAPAHVLYEDVVLQPIGGGL